MKGSFLKAAFALLLWAAFGVNEAVKAYDCPIEQRLVATTPVMEQTPGKLHAAMARSQRAADADTLLVGDSLAVGWEASMNDDFPADTVVGYGVRGEKTQELLWRLRHYPPRVSPRHIVLIIGTNNMSDKTATACGIFAGIEANVALLREKWPDARLTVFPVLPRGNGFLFRNEERVTINAMLEVRYRGDKAVGIASVSESVLTCNNSPVACGHYKADRLHLTESGYKILAAGLPR